MYQVSDDYKLAMKKRVQRFKIKGTVGKKNFTDENILAGSLSITNQCSGNEMIEIGQVYIGELNCTFLNLDISKNSWHGLEIKISFGQELEDKTFEFIPLGVFTVEEASYTESGVVVKAYDNMAKLDKRCSDFDTGALPFVLARKACQACKVKLETTEADFKKFPNGKVTLGYFAVNDVETYRDLISWIAQTCCCFATASRSGGIIFKRYGSEAVDTIDDEHRFTGCSFSDFSTRYTGMSVVNMEQQTTNYYSVTPDDGLTYNLGSNPFLQIPVSHNLTVMRRNVLNGLTAFNYVPFKAACIGNPAYDLGDALIFSNGIADSTKKSVITKFSWVYGREYVMEGVGKNPALASAKSKSDKNISGIINQPSSDYFKCTVVRNSTDVTIGDGESKSVIVAYYLLGSPAHVRFNFEVLLTVTSDSSAGNFADVDIDDNVLTLTPAPAHDFVTVKAVYKSDGDEIVTRYPVETWFSGKHILTLQYDLEIDNALAHMFDLWLEISGGTAEIKAQDAYMVISSTGLASNSNWEGTFRDEDGNLYIVIDGVAHKIPDSIEVAKRPDKQKYEENELLDYTGVIIKAVFGDGSKVTITEQCSFSPIKGTPFDSTLDSFIEVKYVIWTVTYGTGFDLSTQAYDFLEVIKNPTKSAYFDGEKISYRGTQINLVYSDGDTLDVSDKVTFVPAENTVFDYEDLRTKTGLEMLAVTAPEKTRYIQGELFDFTGLEVLAYFTDGSAQNVTDEASYNPFKGDTANESGSVAISFTTSAGESATASFDYRVVTVSNVEFLPPTVLTYKTGDKPDYTGAGVTVTYSDGVTADVTADAVFSPSDKISADTASVDVSYTDLSGHTWEHLFPITVITLQKLRGRLFKDYEFRIGDVIDYSGDIFTATYSDGSTEDVTEFVEYSVSPGTIVEASTPTEITVTYTTKGGDSASTTINLTIITLDYIDFNSMPSKTEYHIGETINFSGLVVKAYYTDGSVETVTDKCIFTPIVITADNTKSKIVYYNSVGEKAVKYLSVDVILADITRIAVTLLPTITTYFVGDTADYSGLKITATYSDGYTGDVVNYCDYSTSQGSIFDSAGTKTVTVTCNTCITDFNVQVIEKSTVPFISYVKYQRKGNDFYLTAFDIAKIIKDNPDTIEIPSSFELNDALCNVIIGE